jgi:hypothetical protein
MKVDSQSLHLRDGLDTARKRRQLQVCRDRLTPARRMAKLTERGAVMDLTSLQARLQQELVRRLDAAGIDKRIKQKVQRLPGDDDEEDEHERALVVGFVLGDQDYEVWLYPDEAGVLEPGDDWWPFDLDGYESEDDLTAAVLEHIDDILSEHSQAAAE